ncbi:MAG TPA: lysoplasmalogenase family protein, partial [Deinococcales bacterium]|nr:lysoplasmalogenase family protein [Deinococcales bacterium]
AAAVLIVLILLAGGYAVARLAPAAGSFGGLVVGYGVAVTAMTCGASAAGLSRSAPGVVLGGLAFFASDLLVARGMFVRQDALNDRLGLPLYYAAQLALAFSAASLA